MTGFVLLSTITFYPYTLTLQRLKALFVTDVCRRFFSYPIFNLFPNHTITGLQRRVYQPYAVIERSNHANHAAVTPKAKKPPSNVFAER